MGSEPIEYPVGKGWIGVDFDRTLAFYTDWKTNGLSLGGPVPLMLMRVQRWLEQGQPVKIFTARASSSNRDAVTDIEAIKLWCKKWIGCELPVTAEKDFNMIELWDDRAVSVEPNTGLALADSQMDPLSYEEEAAFMWQTSADGAV